MYIRTSSFVSFETNTLVCWPIMQHGVRIEAVFASLQQGEHMVESMQFPAYIQSVNRIISKEKEREDPRRDSSKTSFQLESKSVSSVFTRSPVTTTTGLILQTELILPQEIPKKYKNYKAHLVQASSSYCFPCIQTFYTAESRLQAPYSIQGYLETGRVEGEF